MYPNQVQFDFNPKIIIAAATAKSSSSLASLSEQLSHTMSEYSRTGQQRQSKFLSRHPF